MELLGRCEGVQVYRNARIAIQKIFRIAGLEWNYCFQRQKLLRMFVLLLFPLHYFGWSRSTAHAYALEIVPHDH